MTDDKFEFGSEVPEDRMLGSLDRIANDLERVITGIYTCAGLLALLTFLILLRLLIGR